jgi:dienelactone hydrolase
MRLLSSKIYYCCILFLLSVGAFAQSYPPPQQVAADFKALLERPKVPFNAAFQTTQTDSVIIERGSFYSEATEKVPTLIYKPVGKTGKLPVVIFLHGTGGKKDDKEITGMLYKLTKLGFIGVAIDARYHGERIAGGAHGGNEYTDAAYRTYKNTDPKHQEHPFLYDTTYDLWRLIDYLVTRPDIDASRIGMSGISMGGMETWMAAAVDKRIKVVVPNIAAQSFKWSLENDKWQGRAGTIKGAHEKVAKDMGDAALNATNVKALWDKIIPGITGEFDCPSMLRAISPRPMLILSNEKDQNCPLPGAIIAYHSAEEAYKADNASDKLKMDVEAGQPHRSTPAHAQMTLDWFAKWL